MTHLDQLMRNPYVGSFYCDGWRLERVEGEESECPAPEPEPAAEPDAIELEVGSPEWSAAFAQEHEDAFWEAEVARVNEAREDPARDPELRAVQARFDAFEAGHRNGGER